MGRAHSPALQGPHCTDAAMRTSAFIGLSLLIMMMIVVSTPALMDPLAKVGEQAAVATGLLKPATSVETTTGKKGEPIESKMVLDGYAIVKDADPRDTVTPDRRAATDGRLSAGMSRMLLPGELATGGPPAAEDGLVPLDATGCPVFRPGEDITAMMAVPETKALYAGKAAAADNPAACTTSLNARISDAAPAPTDPNAKGTAQAAREDRAAYGSLIDGAETSLLTKITSNAGL